MAKADKDSSFAEAEHICKLEARIFAVTQNKTVPNVVSKGENADISARIMSCVWVVCSEVLLYLKYLDKKTTKAHRGVHNFSCAAVGELKCRLAGVVQEYALRIQLTAYPVSYSAIKDGSARNNLLQQKVNNKLIKEANYEYASLQENAGEPL